MRRARAGHAERATRGAAVRAGALMWSAAPGWVVCFALLCVLGGAAVPVNAWLFAQAVDTVVDGGAVTGWVLAMGASGAVTAAVVPSTSYVQSEVARRLSIQAKSTMMRAVNSMTGLAALERPAFLDRLRLAEQAGAGAPQVLVQAVFSGVRSVVSAAGLAMVLAGLGPWLVVATLASCVPAGVAAVAESRDRARALWRTTPGLRREMFYGGLMTDPRAAKETRVFGLGAMLHDRMVADLRGVASAQRQVERRAAVMQGALAVSGAVLVALALLWGAGRAVAGGISVGELSLLVTGLGGLQAATAAVVRAYGDGHHSVLIFGHYDAVLEQSADQSAPGPGAAPAVPPVGTPEPGGIEIDDVTFSYGSGRPPVLSGVSFTVPAGAMVALVGANGAGKSTVVKLLCRLYEPSGGLIRWDGVNIGGMQPDQVRRRIGVLFQDFMHYDLTAADNVGFGDVERLADRRALRDAAVSAGIDDVLTALPDGYDTMLSRAFGGRDAAEGVQLSGGQWQRVALARSLMRVDADLMILDEPSSGLDAEAEAALYRRLRTMRDGQSCLLVTHRLGAVRHADAIVVLADGRVVERGTHEELVAAGGEYARMYRLQADGYGRSTDAVAS